ncbi:MAG: glycosyltransferase family 39 protein [Actinomycetota bacterium]
MRWGNNFRWAAGSVFVLAVLVRVWVHQRWYIDVPLVEPDTINDNLYYHLSANLLVDGHGFANPFEYYVNDVIVPTAAHPPGYTIYLAIWSFFGMDTVDWHRFAGGVMSASAVLPVGILLRRLFSVRTAVLGMLGVALYPPLWINDALILSESMWIPIAAWALVFAHRAHDDPSIRKILELSAVLSVGALTRSEPFLMFFLLLTPLVMLHRELEWRDRVARTAMAAGLAMVLLAPWVGRNVTIFDEPTYLAVGPGYVLELGNCDDTYSGEFLGYWSVSCDDGTTWPEGADESGIAAAKYEKAQRYIRDNWTQLPRVGAARLGRILHVYRPSQGDDFDVFFERRVESHVQVARWSHYGVMLAAVGGAVVWRRRTTLLPVLAVAGTSLMTAVITFGVTRYRVGADVAFIVLAAVAAGWVLDRYLPSRSLASEPDAAALDPEPAEA